MDGGGQGRLCVGLAVRGDWAGVWATVQAVRLYHAEVAGEIQFVIVDGRPSPTDADEMQGLLGAVPGLRYVPMWDGREALGEVLSREADAALICEIDSGAMLPPGMLAALLDWFDGHTERGIVMRGVAQGNNLGGQGRTFRFVTSTSTGGYRGVRDGLAAGLVAYRRADWPDIGGSRAALVRWR